MPSCIIITIGIIIHANPIAATQLPVDAADKGPTQLHLTVENVTTLGSGLDTHAKAQAMADAAKGASAKQDAYKSGRKVRRVRKEHERGFNAVATVVPEGHRPARHIIRWLRGIEALPQFQLARKDLKANIWRFANALAQMPGFDPKSMTIMPVWERLVNRYGFPSKSIANYFRRLRDWNVLAVVATGRSAAKTPKSTGRTENEAAIYVLLETTPKKSVEKSSAPVPLGGVFNPPHVTRKADSKIQMESAPPITSPKRAAARLGVNRLMRTRKEHFWAPNATQKQPMTKRARREAERLAAAECQFKFFPLQNISTAHVAALIRPLLRAGATVNDILHMIDNRPTTDARYPHDGASGVGNMGAWLRHRLNAWLRADGTFHRFPSQKAESERIQRDAERTAFLARRKAAEAEAQSRNGAESPTRPSWRIRCASDYEAGKRSRAQSVTG